MIAHHADDHEDRVKDGPGALAYRRRKPRKHRAEVRLVERAFAALPDRMRCLDAPCGAGRMLVVLARMGHQVSGVDLSPPILDVSTQTLVHAGLPQADLRCENTRAMTHPDRSFDAVLCFRLFHHYPTAALRAAQVAELCRVADRFVVMSYFSPFSPTAVKRRIRAAFGRRELQVSTHRATVRRLFAAHAFVLRRDLGRGPLHTLRLAVFERV